MERALRCKGVASGIKTVAGKEEEDIMKITRRTFVGGAAGVAAAGLLPMRGWAQAKPPASPVTITVVDVAGNLALTQPMFETYAKAKPEFVASFAFTKAPAPELPSKIQAQQAAGLLSGGVPMVSSLLTPTVMMSACTFTALMSMCVGTE